MHFLDVHPPQIMLLQIKFRMRSRIPIPHLNTLDDMGKKKYRIPHANIRKFKHQWSNTTHVVIRIYSWKSQWNNICSQSENIQRHSTLMIPTTYGLKTNLLGPSKIAPKYSLSRAKSKLKQILVMKHFFTTIFKLAIGEPDCDSSIHQNLSDWRSNHIPNFRPPVRHSNSHTNAARANQTYERWLPIPTD